MNQNVNLSMDGRENLYSKLFLPESNVSIPEYNFSQDADSVIRCKNYNKKTTFMDENDIHNDMTDYIIRAAVIHKNIDKSAEAGTRLQSLRNTISRNVKCLSYSSMNGGALSATLPTGEQFTNSGSIIRNNDKENNKLCKKLNIELNDVSQLESTVLKTLDLIKNNIDTVKTFANSTDYDDEHDKIKNFVNTYKNNLISNDNVFDIINKNRYDIVNKDMTGGKLSNGKEAPEHIKNSYFNGNGVLKNMKDSVYSLDFILSELKNSNSKLGGIKKTLRETLNDTSKNLDTTIAINTVKTYVNNLKGGMSSDTSQRETFNVMSNNMPKYGKLLENNIMRQVKDFIIPKFPNKHLNVESNDINKLFFNGVVKNYNNIDNKQKKIYSNLFDVLKGNTKVNNNKISMLKGGSDVRINLRKVSDGSNSTIFEQYIPEVENADKIHYTDANGQISYEEIAQNDNSKNILKNIYRSIYNSKNSDRFDISTSSGTVIRNVPNNVNNTTTKNRFDLNVTKIIKDTINNKVSQSGGNHNFKSDMFTDMATNEYIVKENNGDLYLFDGTNRCYITKNGVNTNNKKNTQSGGSLKKKLYQCLLDDDSVNLEKNLSNFSKHTAHNEIKDIHPLIALRTLQKFGFKTQNSNGLNKIEDINSWIENFMKKKFTKSQLDSLNKNTRNKNLLEYLNNLSNHVNSHLSILNNNSVINSIMKGGSNTPQKNKINPNNLDDIQNKIKLDSDKMSHKLKIMSNITSSHLSLDIIENIYSYSFLDVGNSNIDMHGGSNAGNYQFPKTQNEIILGVDHISDIINDTVSQLKLKNKVINKNDLNKLYNEITNIKENEKNILKRTSLAATYARCIRNFSEYKNDTDTISNDILNEMIKNCENEKLKMQHDVNNILNLNNSLRQL